MTFFSFTASSIYGVIRSYLYDDAIKPDPGSTNPFLPGANRSAVHRNYTVTVVEPPRSRAWPVGTPLARLIPDLPRSLSLPRGRPTNATLKCGVAWMNRGTTGDGDTRPRTTLVIMRNLATASTTATYPEARGAVPRERRHVRGG